MVVVQVYGTDDPPSFQGRHYLRYARAGLGWAQYSSNANPPEFISITMDHTGVCTSESAIKNFTGARPPKDSSSSLWPWLIFFRCSNDVRVDFFGTFYSFKSYGGHVCRGPTAPPFFLSRTGLSFSLKSLPIAPPSYTTAVMMLTCAAYGFSDRLWSPRFFGAI